MSASVMTADRMVVRQGFLLILITLLGGIAAPYMVNMRMGVGAHVIGLFGGLVLIGVGLARPLFALGPRLWRMMHVSWFAAAYVNWLSATIGGLTGASSLTPIAGAGTAGSSLAETVVFWLFCVVGLSSLVGATLAVYGLRRP